MERGEDNVVTVELSEDLVFVEILPKLPVKSIMRFKCVSRRWLSRISCDPSFINAHLNQQPSTDSRVIVTGYYKERGADADKLKAMVVSEKGSKATQVDTSYVVAGNGVIEIAGSCNGLVCLSCRGQSHKEEVNLIILWNPATRQLRTLPQAPPYASASASTREILDEWTDIKNFGFGFDAASGEYKVVRLAVKGKFCEPIVCAQVFDKSGAVWRDCTEEHGVPNAQPPIGGWAVEANGALHWEMYRLSTDRSVVVSFDLRDEVLRMSNAPGIFNILSKWKSSLAAFTYDIPSMRTCVMWVAEYSPSGAELRWQNLLQINVLPDEWLRQVWRNEFLIVRTTDRKRFWLSLHDTEVAHRVKKFKLKLPGFYSSLHQPYDYVETLVSVF